MDERSLTSQAQRRRRGKQAQEPTPLAVRCSAELGAPPRNAGRPEELASARSPWPKRTSVCLERPEGATSCRREAVNRAGDAPHQRTPSRNDPPRMATCRKANPTATEDAPKPRPRNHWGKPRAPNGPKLSDRGWRRKSPNTKKAPPPASVRWSAWLGGADLVTAASRP
jgi:hypothetical protein